MEEFNMSRLAESKLESQFEEEEIEYKSEAAMMRELRRKEFWANERLKRDKNRDWKNEDGDEY